MSTYDLPQPDQIPEKEKDDAMGAYLMMFAAWGIGLPLPILNLVAFHSLRSTLSQIPVTVVNIGLIAWIVRNLVTEAAFTSNFYGYLVLMIGANVVYVILSLVGMVQSKKGRFFYMPIFGKLSFQRYYGPDAKTFEKPVPPNRPPAGL